MAYSYSSLELYDKCPWAFRKVYLEGVPRQSSESLEIGRSVHERIAGYLEHLIQSKQSTDWQWADQSTLHPEVAAIWERFIQGFTLPPAMEDPGVESKLGFDWNWQPVHFWAPEARFRGVIDFHFRQNGLAVVVDWKTNRQVPETVEKDLQLRIYGWAVRRAVYPDVEEILLKLHFVRYGVERQVLLTPDDLATVPDELDAKIARIQDDVEFKPTPGAFCAWCGVQAHCPVMARALLPVEVVAPATVAQAQRAAELLLALQTVEKELAARLKAWVQENGPLAVGDLVYGPKPYNTYAFDPQEVVQTLLDAGLAREQIWPLLSVNKAALERGLKKLKRQDLLNALLDAAVVRTAERWEFHRQEG